MPRSNQGVQDLNRMMVSKFNEVFGKRDNENDTDPTNDFILPIVPTFGNNDILPHNIFTMGPNQWTRAYTQIWRQFIPEEQRHQFERGGWFSVDVIPNKLTVFSLNTLYFFDSNSAVDGCAKETEPGYEHFEWLRIQLEFCRQRGTKAMLMGHVPPARTAGKMSWDETCWQKYTLWLRQYRDVIVGSFFGHMNIDHFMVQDFKDIDLKIVNGLEEPAKTREFLGDEMTVQGAADYLTDLRQYWGKLPTPPKASKAQADLSWPSYDDAESDGDEGVAADGQKSTSKKKKKGGGRNQSTSRGLGGRSQRNSLSHSSKLASFPITFLLSGFSSTILRVWIA